MKKISYLTDCNKYKAVIFLAESSEQKSRHCVRCCYCVHHLTARVESDGATGKCYSDKGETQMMERYWGHCSNTT